MKCESDKVRGVVFRTKRTNDKKVRKLPKYACPAAPYSLSLSCAVSWLGSVCSVEVLAVLKDGVRFTTLGPKGLRTLGKRLQELDSEYSQLQQELVEKAVDIGRSYVPVIEAAATAVASLDAICRFVHAIPCLFRHQRLTVAWCSFPSAQQPWPCGCHCTNSIL